MTVAIRLMLLMHLINLGLPSFAQKTKIYGTVKDALSGERLPFVNVIFKRSTVGAYTDSLGEFVLETNRRFDSLSISHLGYKTQTISVTHNVTEEIEILLMPDNIALSEVIILPGENPAFEILRRVIRNKPVNNSENADAYEYEVYHKVQFDLNHFTEKIKRNFFVRPFDYIWENADTTPEGVSYLPIILTESDEKHYYRKNPPERKEFIIGRRTVKFFEAPKIMQFVNDMYISLNLYDNYIVILDKSFPSPINDHYKRNYNFYLDDSIYSISDYPCFHINYRPKGKSDVAFTGEMFIDTNSYAVVQADLAFSIEANINFVRNYWVRQNYSVIDAQWFLAKSQIIGDFTVVENSKEMTGFFGRKTSVYRDIIINRPKADDFYGGVDRIIPTDSAYLRSEKFWEQMRGDTLSLEEQSLIKMSGKLNTDRRWIWRVNAIRMIATGWLPWRKIDIGNMFTFYSHNKVEGSRLKFGFRTNDLFYKHWRFKGYVAYGFNDRKFKHDEELNFLFGLKNVGKRNVIGARYRSDSEQQGRTDNIIPLDHIVNSIFRISGKEKRTFTDAWEAFYERQWFTGFSSRATFFHSKTSTFGDYEFYSTNAEGDTAIVPEFITSGARLNIRFAWGDKKLSAIFGKPDKGLFFIRYPVISLEYLMSISDLLKSGFTYQSVKLKLEHQLRLNKWGYLNMIIEGGTIIGKNLPYPLLHVPDGNPIVLNDDHAFNLMNYLEFASDRYVSVQLEQHFEGLLFNKIPGVRKAKLRELIFGKMYYGTLLPENNESTYVFPDGLAPMKEPYFEAGFGIENILKIARVDFIWRINYREQPDILKFIVKPSFYLRF